VSWLLFPVDSLSDFYFRISFRVSFQNVSRGLNVCIRWRRMKAVVERLYYIYFNMRKQCVCFQKFLNWFGEETSLHLTECLFPEREMIQE
jgi:hypothetical protein